MKAHDTIWDGPGYVMRLHTRLIAVLDAVEDIRAKAQSMRPSKARDALVAAIADIERKAQGERK